MLNHTDPSVSFALLRAQQGYGWHMHDGGYMIGPYWGFGAILHVIFWLMVFVAIVAATLILTRTLGRKGSGDGKSEGSSALDQLDERYAKGEIDRDEYLQHKKDIMER